MNFPDPRRLFVDDRSISDEEFRNQNIVYLITAAIMMIVGPLFIYHGFNLLPWPYTTKWGALSIAIGAFILIFGFSIWQRPSGSDSPANVREGCHRDKTAP